MDCTSKGGSWRDRGKIGQNYNGCHCPEGDGNKDDKDKKKN